jgi:hypothetical protein
VALVLGFGIVGSAAAAPAGRADVPAGRAAVPAGRAAAPAGTMTWGVHITLASRWCCKKHPEDPQVTLFVEFDNGSIVTRVKASHACGIKRISVWIADKETSVMQPGDVKVDSYLPKLIGGGSVDTSVDVTSTSGRPVEKTLRLPANVPVDETFYVAATAVSVCDTQAGDNEGPYVLV